MVDSSDRRQHRGERFRDSLVVKEERSGRASTMIWAGIYANDRILVYLVFVVGRGGRRPSSESNAQRYINTALYLFHSFGSILGRYLCSTTHDRTWRDYP
jgi:hypothetical protein